MTIDIPEKKISLRVETDYDVGARLDKFLAEQLTGDYSRARLQGLIKEGAVTVNTIVQKKGSMKLEMHDGIEIVIPPVKSRVYHAMVLKTPMPPVGKVDMALGRDPNNRLKMTTRQRNGRDAVTHYKVLRDFSGFFSLVECRLETGRTHQIRVHMQAIGQAEYPADFAGLYSSF